MNRKLTDRRGGTWVIFLFALAFCALFAVNARAFVVNVVDPAGAPISGGFRWLLEEDNTNVTVPGVPVRVSISTDIHNSHAPVVNNGQVVALNTATITTDASGSPLDISKRYFISVLPHSGYSISGTVVEAPNPATVTVTVNPLPLPTAQISLFAFVDHSPINNVADPQEQGLGGATVLVSDAAGQLMQDAFGNPLGTQYAFDAGTGQAILDGDGNPTVMMMGNGAITTLTQEQFDMGGMANPYNLRVGEAIIKYLVPGKYGVKVVPPGFDDNGAAMTWSLTSTIEGTPTVDAWVKANEPKLFVEGFGTGFNHVFYGFLKVSPDTSTFMGQTFTTLEWNQTPPAAATGTITGTLRMNHFSRPPTLQGYFPGIPVPGGWVGLNDPVAVAGKYAAACNEDGSFVINNVPPGTYQLVTWDTNLDTLFGFYTVTVPPGPAGTGDAVTLGNVLTFRWFGALENYVFFDADEDGFRDPGEPGIPEQNVNLRFRDGTIYQAFPTDLEGFVPFDEVFPFFKWLVVEVDFARFKATGMTTAVDHGGPIPGPDWPANGNKSLQPQNPLDPFNVYGTLDYRSETGPVLTQAMHLFLGQTNLIEWGKSSYKVGENGGISGIVFYAVTHAENDPRYAAAEGWEPGIPRVQVNLYADMIVNATGLPGSDGVVDDLDNNAAVTLADVDNYPFQWAPMYTADPGFTGIPGPEDVDDGFTGVDLASGNGVFDFGDAIDIATTDSWDDSKPSGCIQDLPFLTGLGTINECADNFGTWNQVRPGIFDGGYAFGPEIDCPGGVCPEWVNQSVGDPAIGYIKPGSYIVQAVPPPGYELLKEEDKNVDFGDTYIPSPLLLPPVCVGDLHTVPDFMSFDGITPAPFAGELKPYCDRKQVNLGAGQNAAADFFLFTQVPKAARAVGFVNNDLGAEFNQGSPIYGEKLAPAWIPISFRDWQGHELTRVYSDEFGGYNALLPSTYTVNVPSPTGVSPNMITLVLNDPYLADGVTPDPFYDPDYSVTPWTFHYMPGASSYLDTPLVPVAAFTVNEVRLDTGPANGTPVIHAVTTDTQPGPLICTDAPGADNTVTINAPPGGTITIRNPEYPTLSSLPIITRDVGFGTSQGNGMVTLDGVELVDVTSWSNEQIVVNVPGGNATGRLMITRNNGLTSEVGVTLNIENCSVLNVHTVAALSSIQDAVDAAVAGDIILVGTGQFNENVIMHKPVRLQGSGAGSFINGNPTPLDRLDAWHTRVNALDPGDQIIPTYNLNTPFSAGEAPGIFVVGATTFPNTQIFNPGNPFNVPGQAAIDGFTISGSKAGGGIFVFSGALNLEISNNNITGNQGSYAGGIAIGASDIGLQGLGFDPANDGIVIRHNKIHRNGGTQGGGGIALNEGADGYLVDGNIIIGNFGRYNGGGIQHRGLSLGDNIIRRNRILFNEIFYGALLALAGDGAGIYIGGDAAGGTGSGSVTIDSNLIQGNMTGSGNGAGIRAFAVNGEDIANSPGNDASWYRLNIFNNMIVNNVAGNSGAGISLQDVARANIVNNTIARNDSTATSALTFQAGQANSTPQPAGIAAGLHSAILQGLLPPGDPTYSDPLLVNNIIWQNRSFYNDASLNGGAGGLAVNPAGEYWDLHVMGSVSETAPHLDPDYCILSNLTNPATGFDYTLGGTDTTNSQTDPGFIGAYFNAPESTTVVDEGGNTINIRFTPLTVLGSDYHIGTGQAGSDGPLATFPELAVDFDGEPRPYGPDPDIGADEVQPAAIALLSWEGVKNLAQVAMGPLTTGIQTGSAPQTSATIPAGTITALTGAIDDVKEKLTGIVESLVPGRRQSTGSGSDDSGRAIISSLSGNIPNIANGKDVSVGNSQLLTKGTITGDEGINPTNNTSTPLPQGEVTSQALSSPLLGEASLSGNGVESSLSAAQTNQQSGTSLDNTRQQGESKSTMFRYVLVGLILGGLASIFFIVIMPKTKKRREQ